MRVLVTGATGFVGRRVTRALCERGAEVRALVHGAGNERALGDLKLELAYGEVTGRDSLLKAMDGVDAVAHLVAIIREKGKSTFESVNVKGSENVAAAAREAGVKRIVHVSAVGARDDRRFPYLRSKWLGEQAVTQSGVPYVILRPSLMFGEGDEFFNTLAALVKLMPVVPMPGRGKALFQPIAADDLARCVAQSVDDSTLAGQTVEVGGPDRFTYREMIGVVAETLGVRRLYLPAPVPVLYAAAGLMELFMPRPPITRRQLDSLPVDNVAPLGEVERCFGFAPRPLRGNIDYVRRLAFSDALKTFLGVMPRRVRDH